MLYCATVDVLGAHSFHKIMMPGAARPLPLQARVCRFRHDPWKLNLVGRAGGLREHNRIMNATLSLGGSSGNSGSKSGRNPGWRALDHVPVAVASLLVAAGCVFSSAAKALLAIHPIRAHLSLNSSRPGWMASMQPCFNHFLVQHPA